MADIDVDKVLSKLNLSEKVALLAGMVFIVIVTKVLTSTQVRTFGILSRYLDLEFLLYGRRMGLMV